MSVDKFGRYDHAGKKLSTDLSDVAGMTFVKNNCLLLSTANNCYDAKNRCIRNVTLPSLPNDAATMQYIQNYSLGRTTDMNYTAKNKLIRELGDPVLTSDAANMGFVIKNSLKRTHPDGNIDMEGKLLRNLASPSLPSDAVNLAYIQEKTPKMYDKHWIFYDKRLSNVEDPIYDGEVVTLRTLKRILTKLTNHHELQLRGLSSAIFNYIHRTTGRTAQEDVTSTNYLDMEEIINKELFETELLDAILKRKINMEEEVDPEG